MTQINPTLFNIIIHCLEILVNFLSCDPENSAIISPSPVLVQLYSKFWLLVLLCKSLELLETILFKPHQIIFMMCIIMSETSRSLSNSHQHSYFQIKALSALNRERERELSSAFDKPLVNLCDKNQTYLCQAVCISTQSKPQTSVFQERYRPKNNYLDCFIVMK